MKMHKVLYARALPWLFAVVAVAVGWADSQPADAAFTSTLSSAVVNVIGTIAGAPESIRFTGTARIDANAVTDPDFGGPTQVVFSVDLTGLTGTGATTNTTFVTPTKLTFVRPLAPVDSVNFTFPLFPSGAAQTTAGRLGKVTVNLVYNPALLRLTQGVVLVAAP